MTKKTILHVDDEIGTLTLTGIMFERGGYNVLKAKDADAALAILEQNLPDLIITDVMMFPIDGIELIEMIRQRPDCRHIPILVLSARGDADSVMRGMEAGANDYLPKPILHHDLVSIIRSMLAQVSETALEAKPEPVPDEPEEAQEALLEAIPVPDEREEAQSEATPKKSMPDEPKEISKAETEEERPKRIIIVDDDPALLRLVSALLIRARYDVVFQAFSAMEAEQYLNANHHNLPDLLITDLMMPQISGIEFIKALRSKPIFRYLPIIILSALADPEQIREGLDVGTERYLTKPYLANNLVKTVNEIFNILSRIGIMRRFSSDMLGGILVIVRDTKIMPAKFSKKLVTHILRTPIWYRGYIATVNPACIVLWQEVEVIEKLRRFQLSSNLPIVLVTEDVPDIKAFPDLYHQGADEICMEGQLSGAIQAAIKQYERPTLVEIGQQWDVLIASTDSNLRTQASEYLTKTFYAEVRQADSEIALRHLCAEKEPTLILLDSSLEDWSTLLQDLRRELVESPVLLMTTELDKTILSDGYRLNVRGYLPNPLTENALVVTIERLLRWGVERKTLAEIWSGYRLEMTELVFESRIRKQAPETSEMIAEIGMLYGGLIHDIRNVFYSLDSQLMILETGDKIDEDAESIAILRDNIRYTEILLEVVANLRFKGAWQPKEHHALVDWIETTIRLLGLSHPQLEITIDNQLEEIPSVVADENQVLQILFIALLIFSENNAAITIVLQKEKSKQIEIYFMADGLGYEQLKELFSGDTPYMLVLNKLIARHEWRMTIKKNQLLIIANLSYGQGLRLDIAEYATETEKLQSQMPDAKKIPELSIAPLVHIPLEKLIEATAKLIPLTQNFGKQGKRLELTARYGLLLARNMLVTAANIKPQAKSINIHNLLRVATGLRNDLLRDCDVEISVDLETPPVFADELGLLQIFTNLITNAVEAMGGEGELYLSAQAHPEGVIVTVRDTGQGIPPDKLERIFDLFYTSKSGHERGVGLHIVTSIVKELQGRIEVESELKKGTTFRIILPTQSD